MKRLIPFLILLLCVGGCQSRRLTGGAPAARRSIQPAGLPAPGSTSPGLGEKLPNRADYVLAPEDVLDINVWKNDALTRTVFIRPDGKISLPLIGDVQAAGLTPDQLKDIIKELLQEYKELPEVSVVVRDIGSFAVYITGQVLRPGKLQLRSETTLIQALTQAGGFTPFAERNKILVLRREGDYETRIKVRYDDIVSGRRLAENIVLKRGDTIIVP